MADQPSGSYVGIRNSDGLRRDIDLFLENIHNRINEPQHPLLAHVMEQFLDEALQGLLISACDAVQFQGFARRAVEMTANTIKGTCRLLSKKILKGMRNDELLGLAEHMDQMRFVTRDANQYPVGFTVMPVSDSLQAEIDTLLKGLDQPPDSRTPAQIESVLHQLLETCVEYMYFRTLTQLRLGPLARRMVKLGYETVHSGMNSLIRHVVSHLSEQQQKEFIHFSQGLVIRIDGDQVRIGGKPIVPFAELTREISIKGAASDPA
jgi:hypothetical protein